jgi:hypothetical protein
LRDGIDTLSSVVSSWYRRPGTILPDIDSSESGRMKYKGISGEENEPPADLHLIKAAYQQQ